jgi:hypothetical protein
MEESQLITFNKIANFVKDLNGVFGDKQKSLALYNRLIEKTTIAHESAVKKHIECFTIFCNRNRDAIISQDITKIIEPDVKYSDKVYIDIKNLIAIGDKDTIDAIWNHLLIICNSIDPASGAISILKSRMSKTTDDSTEDQFITNLISKVESAIDPNKIENPMDAITTIMSSGILTDIVGGVQKGISDGSLDIGKLMGSMTGILAKNGGDPSMLNGLSGLAGGLGGLGGLGGAAAGGNGVGGLPIDLSMITSMMGSMMGGLNTQQDDDK